MSHSAVRPRVLFLNDVGLQYGAGVAEARQIQSLLLLGWEVGALAWEPAGISFEQLQTRPSDSSLWLGLRRVRHLERGAPMTEQEIVAGLLGEISRFDPTIVIVGNLHAASWPLELLEHIRRLGYRVIAYMHDGYLFSGRCAYPGTCQLYLTGCNHTCPTASEYPPLPPAEIAGQWNLRRALFGGPEGVEVVANSHWTAERFRAAIPNCASCETIYLGADENVFCPGDKVAARLALGWPLDRPVVLCSAVNFEEKRKGTADLAAVIQTLEHEVFFAAFGHNSDLIPGLHGLGYRNDQSDLARVYQASDVFLGTAGEEAFGQTIVEAQLCGVPVVAYQVGGVSEIIRGELTGKLVKAGDVSGAVAALRELLSDHHFRHRAEAWARDSAARRFSLGAQGERWRLYFADYRTRGTGARPPSISYPQTAGDVHLPHRPSWPTADGSAFTCAEHPRIFDNTSHLPGWQMPGDSLKLYEMGYHAGDVILEIGTYGGRSATVELRGALANPTRTAFPQFYGIDICHDSITRTRQTLADQQLIDFCHLFEGNLQQFVERWSVSPTMVFLDGDHRYEGVKADLEVLGRYLRPGTPILMHDYLNPENDTGAYGVRRAALEWAADTRAVFMGCFGCTALYLSP